MLEEDLRRQYYTSPRVSVAAQSRLREGAEVQGPGSGVGGMILSSDVGAPTPAARISGIREKIARRMRESLAATAQYTLNASADAGGLLLVRAKVKASKGVPDININDLVTFCTVKALLEVPELNAEFLEGRILKHAQVHIGFACDTPRGLMVPVVRDAHTLTAGELSIRMKELTARAVAGTIAVDDLSGGTFTVSNLGGLGIESFTPLLNPPQVAILGIDAIGLKAVRRDGSPAIWSRMPSCFPSADGPAPSWAAVTFRLLHHRLHRRQLSLWRCALLAHPSLLPRPARCVRRRHAAHGAGHHGRFL